MEETTVRAPGPLAHLPQGKGRLGFGTGALSRRAFGRLGLGLVGTLGVLWSGCGRILQRGSRSPAPPIACANPAHGDAYDYIVVGSGAGGGPLAANLARAGYRVLLLEAGGQDEPYSYKIPAFHGLASEDERLRWEYFVRHYTSEDRQRRDDKFVEAQDPARRGILYPRSGTLGGCTAHNAMITVYPHNSDWDHIAQVTGDASWGSENMRRYFERLERCQYRTRPADPSDVTQNPARHGFDGWLATSMPDVGLAVEDKQLLRVVLRAVRQQVRDSGEVVARIKRTIRSRFDPNDWRNVQESVEGTCLTPLATEDGRRNGTREYIRRVRDACPNLLVVKTGALVSRVLFGADNTATGVEYLEGEHLYRADPGSRPGMTGITRTVRAAREVILAAGAFNTPQLLKLSGVGPRDELLKHGIEVRVDLPGVGENLQDRYEVGVVLEMAREFSLLNGTTLKAPEPGEEPNPLFRQWEAAGEGPYTTNGAVLAVVKRSEEALLEPDLFIFGVVGYFRGYYPGYSNFGADPRSFTWAVLKAHTNNTAGRVTLRSTDPRDVPEINFHYFDEGNDRAGSDLEAVVDGVEYARQLARRAGSVVKREVIPGNTVRTRDEIREFVRNNAWGHHASCSCKMGPVTDRMAVVDSGFRVHGTRNLRVVDASVFPRIPGFFIVTPIYMISEKASDVILADARRPAAAHPAPATGRSDTAYPAPASVAGDASPRRIASAPPTATST